MKREIRECLTCGYSYCKNELESMRHICPDCEHGATRIISIEEDELHPDRNDEDKQEGDSIDEKVVVCVKCRKLFRAEKEPEFSYACPYCGHKNSVFDKEPECEESIAIEIADRFNDGKLQWSMVDFKALEDMVRVLEFGAKKYSRDNWKKGLKTTEVVDSMLRHIYAYLDGEDIDPESGINHTGHIMCNAMFLSHMHLFRKDMDTRCKILSKE